MDWLEKLVVGSALFRLLLLIFCTFSAVMFIRYFNGQRVLPDIMLNMFFKNRAKKRRRQEFYNQLIKYDYPNQPAGRSEASRVRSLPTNTIPRKTPKGRVGGVNTDTVGEIRAKLLKAKAKRIVDGQGRLRQAK